MPFLGRKVKKGRTPCVVISIILQVLGFIFSLGMGLNFTMGGVFDGGIKDAVIVTSAEEKTSMAVEGDSVVQTDLYFYNLTNEAQVMGGAQPVFETVGPYVFTTYSGGVGDEYFKSEKEVSYWGRTNQVLDESASPSTDLVITTLDPVYIAAFGVNGLAPSESGLIAAMGVTYAGAIHTFLGQYLLTIVFGQEIEANPDYLSDLMTSVSTNSGESIQSTDDLLYLQYGSGAIFCDGNSAYQNMCGIQSVSAHSAQTKGTVGAILLAATYLTQAQKDVITNAFVVDSSFIGIGIYQVMRILNLDDDVNYPECAPLTLSQSKTVMNCLFDPECGLAVAGLIVGGDITTALSMTGLTTADTCYLGPIAAYSVLVAPLNKHFFQDRLLAEKGDVSGLPMIKLSAGDLINGYDSPALNALGEPAQMVGYTLRHTSDDLAKDGNSYMGGGTKFQTKTGAKKMTDLNIITKINGAVGLDYNGDGSVTEFADQEMVTGTNFPPNQKGLEWTPTKKTYNIYQSGIRKGCDFEITKDVKMLGDYEAPIFVRNEETCFANDVQKNHENGFANMYPLMGAPVFVSSACMSSYPSYKTWVDDCDMSEDYSSWYAIDSLTGAPWAAELHDQLNMGVDSSTGAYDVSSSMDVSKFPVFRMKNTLQLAAKDEAFLVGNFMVIFLLKDVISWVTLGVSILFNAIGIALMLTSLEKVSAVANATKPVASTKAADANVKQPQQPQQQQQQAQVQVQQVQAQEMKSVV